MTHSALASAGTFHAFRLRPHEDLKAGILEFARTNNLKAAAIVTCVGSLEHLELRFANESKPYSSEGPFEILSLSGTFSSTAAHLHMSVANRLGQTFGGHLLDNNRIFTTAELVIVVLGDLAFDREEDLTYGYSELVVKPAR